MYFIGMDAHKARLVICVMNGDREVVAKARISCGETETLSKLTQRYRPAKVVLEASGCVTWLIDFLRDKVEEVVLAHPNKLRVISQTVKKTDKVDAQVLAELLSMDYVPRAYIANEQERSDRTLVRTVIYLQKAQRRAKQRIRFALNRNNWQSPVRDVFSKKGRQWLIKQPWKGGERLEIESALAMLDTIAEQRERLDKMIGQRMRDQMDAQRLRTIPGFGPLTIVAFLSILGDWRRFSSSSEVAAFFGLVPRVNQSSQRCHLGHITRQGDPYVRSLLVEAAWQSIRKSKRLRQVFDRIAKRRGRKIAIVAIARRLAVIAMALLREQTVFGKPHETVKKIAA